MTKRRWMRWAIPAAVLACVLAGCFFWGWSQLCATLPPETIKVLERWEYDGRQGLDLLVEDVLFEDMVYGSDTAVVAEFLDRQDYEHYSEYRFRVKECLYGDVQDAEIYIYERHGAAFVGTAEWTYIDEQPHVYALGKGSGYQTGGTYILILNRYESIFYAYDRNMTIGQTLLREDTGEYKMYLYNVRIPDGLTMREYVCRLHEAPTEIVPENPVAWYNGVSYTFEDLVRMSDVILMGTYRDKARVGDTSALEYRFEVRECLYGGVEDAEIYVYTVYAEDNGAVLNPGLSLDAGAEYILLMNRFQNVKYEHDRYIPLAIIRTQGGSPYSSRGARLFDFTGSLTAQEYVQAVCARVKPSEDAALDYVTE